MGKRLHGHRSRTHETPTHRSWRAMRLRCNSPNNKFYKDYGGIGVRVCERWSEYANFLADMGERPAGMTLDRIDHAKDYEPGNCRWATPKEQARNRSLRKDRIIHEGRPVEVWAELWGVSRFTASKRIKRAARQSSSQPLRCCRTFPDI